MKQSPKYFLIDSFLDSFFPKCKYIHCALSKKKKNRKEKKERKTSKQLKKTIRIFLKKKYQYSYELDRNLPEEGKNKKQQNGSTKYKNLPKDEEKA